MQRGQVDLPRQTCQYILSNEPDSFAPSLESALEKYLDLVLPGLGDVARRDQPLVRIWPPQISQSGFTAAFHRHTPKAAQRGELSRWVLVAGRAQAGRTVLLIGLGLWADQPNTLDRLTLDPSQ